MLNTAGQCCKIFILCALFSVAVTADSESVITDKENSKWIVFGGKAGVESSSGISIRDGGSEGALKPETKDGLPCAASIRPGNGKTGLFYIVLEPWEDIKKWLGDGVEPVLSIKYFDGAPGRLVINYDSSDERVKHPPYPNGVWRHPDQCSDGIELKGTKTWQTASIRLPLAFFTKRLHGADIRLDPTTEDFALAELAVSRGTKTAGGEPAAVSQDLNVEKAEGMTSFGKGARFAGIFAQDGAEDIVMEAELATSLCLQDGHSAGADAGASGGAYIHFVDSAVFKFTVKTPGKYFMWERSLFPIQGGWNHNETLDGSEEYNIVDHSGPPSGWKWMKTHEYDLYAGEHTFSLSYHGGAKLDVLVFSRDSKEPVLANLKSSYNGPVSGEVTTVPVRPFDVKKWVDAEFRIAGAEKTEISFSSDNGGTWQPFNGALSDVKAAGNGDDSMKFKLKISGKEGAAPPFFAGGAVSFISGPNNFKTVENERLKVQVDPYGIKSIFDKKTGLAVSNASEPHAAVAGITIKKPGAAPVTVEDLYTASFESFTCDNDKASPAAELIHRTASGILLKTNMKLLENGQIEWRLDIDNPTGLEVAEIRFPVITGLQLGGNAQDDWMFMAKCWGQIWQNPGKGGRLSSFWGPSMRWAAIWDEKVGFYYGIEDERFDDCGFIFGGDASGGATLSACQRILVRPESKWKSAVYRTAVTSGDWHEGADIYRKYNSDHLKKCDSPPYVKWLVDTWCTQDSNHTPDKGWDVIRPTALNLMAANRQMTDGADSGYCGLYPYPCPAWGSIDEFKQKLEVRRAFGGTYTPYHNFHLWSPGYGHYKRIGSFPKSRLPANVPKPDDEWYSKAATYSYDGTYPRLEKDYFAQLDMAMPSKEWRDWLYYWTASYLEWGADGMYYDQFNMIYGNGRLYDEFPTYGCWMPATLEVISRIKKDSRKKDPFYTSSGEVCNDAYGQYLDLHMTSGVFNRLECYRFCNPEQLIIDGGWNGGLGPAFGGWERERFIWQVGARFEQLIGPDGAYNPQNPETGLWARKVLALRRAVKGIAYDAQFMDDKGISMKDASGKALKPEWTYCGSSQNAPYRGVTCKWFLLADDKEKGALLNIINAVSDGKPESKCSQLRGAVLSIDTGAFSPVKSALAFTLDGSVSRIDGKQDGNIYSFEIPASELSSVILSSGRMRPVVEWDIDSQAATASAARNLRMKITNPNPEDMEGKAELRLPQGFAKSAAAEFGPLPFGESIEFSVPVAVKEDAPKGRHDVWCDISTNTGAFSAYHFIVVNDPLVADLRGNPGNYHLWLKNLSNAQQAGKISCGETDGLKVSCPASFKVPAGAEMSIPVEVSGNDKLKEISEIKIRVKTDKQDVVLRRGVMPVLPNGDFEMDSAGDMKPDWWMCRKKGDDWSYERMYLDKDAHSGSRSLRLDPPDKEKAEEFITAYPVNSALKPGTKYKVSLWIKSESKDGVFARFAGRELGKGQTGPEWKMFSAEFKTGPGTESLAGRILFNYSDKPAFFDDIEVCEIAGN